MGRRLYLYQYKNQNQRTSEFRFRVTKYHTTKIIKQSQRDVDPINRLSGFRIPAFFIHGNQDAIIPIHLFKRVFEVIHYLREFSLNNSLIALSSSKRIY